MGIGEQLSHSRKNKGIAIEIAAEATKIRGKFLLAMEQEEFDLLPGRAYARAFLRLYARYLGLDDAVMVQEFEAFYAGGQELSTNPRHRQKHRPGFNWRRFRGLLVMVVVIGSLVAFNALYEVIGSAERAPVVVVPSEQVPQSPKVKPQSSKMSPAKISPASLPADSAGQVAIDKQTPEQPKNSALSVGLNVTSERCWMRITTDDGIAFEGELNAGEKRDFQARNRIALWLGNAGAVQISCNGKNLGYMGNTGQVIKHEFSRNGKNTL